MDYAGISILIFGSCVPVLYYAMACNRVHDYKVGYLSAMGVACLACFIVTLIPKFDQEAYRKWRGIMYIILGVSCGFMFLMFAFLDAQYISQVKPWVYILGGYIYIQGAIIYMVRCPERCSPGTFDLCGASHQIFHFAVLIGALLHFWENYLVFRHR